jgi:hypothetical protein
VCSQVSLLALMVNKPSSFAVVLSKSSRQTISNFLIALYRTTKLLNADVRFTCKRQLPLQLYLRILSFIQKLSIRELSVRVYLVKHIIPIFASCHHSWQCLHIILFPPLRLIIRLLFLHSFGITHMVQLTEGAGGPFVPLVFSKQ